MDLFRKKTQIHRIVLLLGAFSLTVLVFLGYNMNSFYHGKRESKIETLGSEQKRTILNLYKRILNHESKIYSQNNEDGVLMEMIDIFKLNDTKYFVEIGTQSGIECNTR